MYILEKKYLPDPLHFRVGPGIERKRKRTQEGGGEGERERERQGQGGREKCETQLTSLFHNLQLMTFLC